METLKKIDKVEVFGQPAIKRPKIVWDGNVFNNTGIATANRMLLYEILSQDLADVQILDVFNGVQYDEIFKKQKVIDSNDPEAFYIQSNPGPQMWFRGINQCRNIVFNLYEGTTLRPGWAEGINNYSRKLIVPSRATKNLFSSNGVIVPVEVVNFGVDINQFKPEGKKVEIKLENSRYNEDTCVFLSVNSWSLEPKDRKGTDLLIQAFCEEFTEENVVLFLKISTFWRNIPERAISDKINQLSAFNQKAMIIFDNRQLHPDALASLYRTASCFVSPTRGESWGLTLSEAMATGTPVITTKDNNSGHMDFCKQAEGVFFVDTEGYEQADTNFFPPGNMQVVPSIKSLRKQLRKVFDMWNTERDKLKKLGLKNREVMQNFTWGHSARKFIEVLKNNC